MVSYGRLNILQFITAYIIFLYNVNILTYWNYLNLLWTLKYADGHVIKQVEK